VVEISAGRQRPYYIKTVGMEGGTYIRVAGTSRLADKEQIKEMFYESEGRSYDCVIRKDLTITEEDIEKLCQMLREKALANCKNDSQRSEVKMVTKNTLLSWGVIAEENGKLYPTNAYVFLLGLDSFLSRIQCGVFKGTTRAIFVDRREYTGPIWEQIEEAFRFVLRNIHLVAKIEGIYREDIYELPPESIRELIINAAVHCSFLQSSLIQVAIYDDRLEITSPGGLLPGVTVERMKEGYSKVRNHAIASAFSYMKMIEQWGSGVPRIIREVSAYGLSEPEFLDMECALRINIYRNANDDTIDTIRDTNDDTIDINHTEKNAEQHLLELIEQSPDKTQKEYAAILGISVPSVKRMFAKLQSEGGIKREGTNRKGRWIIINS